MKTCSGIAGLLFHPVWQRRVSHRIPFRVNDTDLAKPCKMVVNHAPREPRRPDDLMDRSTGRALHGLSHGLRRLWDQCPCRLNATGLAHEVQSPPANSNAVHST